MRVSVSSTGSSYDQIAGMYHELWADWYLPAAMPALERLFFSQVKTGLSVIDLCCGSGHVTKELVLRGYDVTGVDNSAELIALARKQLPGINFVVQDARRLRLERTYDAAISTFDSLNHILDLDDLLQVFLGVRRSLKNGGRFVFDMNLEEAYALDLKQWSVDIKENAVGLVRGKYNTTTHLAETELIWFVRAEASECWHQHRSLVRQRCYPKFEIVHALQTAGFEDIEVMRSSDAGITAELGYGRMFFIARV